MKNCSDVKGMEFDWFAIDSAGFVGWMMTGGHGPIPDFVFQHFDQQRCLEEHLTQLSGYSTKDPWRQMVWSLSRAGIFIYDWKHWDGFYRRVGFPLFPRRIDKFGISSELRATFVTFPKYFWMSRRLRPERLFPCAS